MNFQYQENHILNQLPSLVATGMTFSTRARLLILSDC